MTEQSNDFIYPQHLVETDWLEAHLGDADLRILDCTVYLSVRPDGSYDLQSGRTDWAASHIPGSIFADVTGELSDTESDLNFTLPSAEQFTAAMERYGVGQGTQVVLYDRTVTMWATRVWWMLRYFGFDNAAVLNGGWRKWQQEGRPVSSEATSYPPATFVSKVRPSLFVDKEEILDTFDEDGTCLLNALGPQSFASLRIPASINVTAATLLDPATNAYLPAAALREKFDQAGVTDKERVIAYCGGGISATSDAFILTLLGIDNVAVYDGSMSEWRTDPALPTESG